MKNAVLLYLFLLGSLCTTAQQKEFVFKNYTQEDGLPSNETYFIFEDSRHYLWIATDNGVVVYNGNKFETLDLPDNVIFRILEDSKGRVWFFSHKAQLAYFEKGKVHLFKYNKNIARRIQNIHIKDAYIDDSGNISLSSAVDSNFIIKADGSIIAFNHWDDTDIETNFTINVAKNNSTYTQAQQQGKWGFQKMNVKIIKENSQQTYQIHFNHINSSQFGSICPNGKDVYFFYGLLLVKLNEDGSYIFKQMPSDVLSVNYHDKGLFVGLNKGGMAYLNEDLSLKENNIILPGKSISSIVFDYENGMWLSSLESGAYFVKNRSIKHAVLVSQNEPGVSRLFNYNDSILIYGNSQGIFQLAQNSNKLLLKVPNINITDIFSNNDKTLFCFGGFSTFYNKILSANIGEFKYYFLANNPTSEPIILYGNTWFISTSLEIIKFKSAFLSNTKYKLPTDLYIDNKKKEVLSKPAKLFLDKDSVIWGGTNDGLYKSYPPYDTLIKFQSNQNQFEKGVSTIRQLYNGILTVGIRSGGIMLVDSNLIVNITEADGLLSNKVRYILPVQDQLWVATVKGISVIQFKSYKPLEYTIRNIDKTDGLLNLTINQLIQYNGDIVAATSNGIYYIESPHNLMNKKTESIPFYITGISYYKGDSSEISSITLPYSKNRIIIKYKAISFNSFENIQYYYRFDNGDTIWHRTNSTELVFENLEPGTYDLQVKAIIQQQQRSSPVQHFTIIIEKAWWQNNWLRLLAAFLCAGLIYFIISKRIKKIKGDEKRRTDLNAKLAELEQTALRSQMNPHFIFNCLTSIQQLIISGNKTDANEYLVKFSRLIRKTLEMSAQHYISVREEKEYLEEYLFLEQLRLAGKFDYIITAEYPLNMDQVLIPNMMIQPVVENCVRHGIKSLEKRKGLVKVSFQLCPKTIRCVIADNGIGRNNTVVEKGFTKHKSYGIEIVRKRLETFSEFNTDDSGIEIRDIYDSDGQPAGTEVLLQLPYKKTV